MSDHHIARRHLLLGAGGAAAVAGLAACGMGTDASSSSSATAAGASSTGPLSGSITFQTWSLKGDRFTPYFTKLVNDFQSQHSGVTINWVDQPGDGYEDKVLQQAQAGNLPDVINLPPDFAYQLAKVNKLVDLKSADQAIDSTYTPGGLKAYQYDGLQGTFGYPWYLGTDLNWWNTTAFKQYGLDPTKLPTSTDEMFQAAITMAQKSNGKMPLLSAAPGLDAFKGAGADVFSNGKFTFNNSTAVGILQKYVDLYKQKAMPPEVLQSNYLGNSKLYQQGKVAWTTGTSSFFVDLKKNAPSLVSATKPTPRFGTPPLFVQGISVSKDSKNAALALAFAQFVTNNANQIEFVKLAQGFMPGTVEANNNPSSFTSAITDKDMADATKLAAAQMPKAEMLTPIQFTSDMSTYTAQQIALAMRGDISAQSALDKAVQYCNSKLS